jgi:hypothetical protein
MAIIIVPKSTDVDLGSIPNEATEDMLFLGRVARCQEK